MEEKESTVSGSPVNSETESPPPVMSNMATIQPQVVNMNMNMGMGLGMGVERSFGVAPATSATTIGTTTMTTAAATAVTTTTMVTTAGLGSSGSGDLLGKKKRGRPRKYDSDGNLRVPYSLGLSSSPPGFPLSSSSPSNDNSNSKKCKGRPSGSGNWQLLASLGELFASTAGGDFTPHVVTVHTGEDVAGKILSFSQKGPRGICILSANGAVSNVTIRQPGSSGGILTYEGRFEILSLSGSFTISDSGNVRSRTGGLSVSLAGPDGRVIGGGIAGLLTAASPIQIVVGSFMPNGYKAPKKKYQREQTISTIVPPSADSLTGARPISQAKADGEPCLAPASPAKGQQSHGEAHSSVNDMKTANSLHSAGWMLDHNSNHHRPSPDINVSVPSE